MGAPPPVGFQAKTIIVIRGGTGLRQHQFRVIVHQILETYRVAYGMPITESPPAGDTVEFSVSNDTGDPNFGTKFKKLRDALEEQVDTFSSDLGVFVKLIDTGPI